MDEPPVEGLLQAELYCLDKEHKKQQRAYLDRRNEADESIKQHQAVCNRYDDFKPHIKACESCRRGMRYAMERTAHAMKSAVAREIAGRIKMDVAKAAWVRKQHEIEHGAPTEENPQRTLQDFHEQVEKIVNVIPESYVEKEDLGRRLEAIRIEVGLKGSP